MNHQNENHEMTDDEAMNDLAEMIDRASDTRDSGLTTAALSFSERLAKRPKLSGESQVLLHYFRANAFENRLRLAGQGQTWAWDIPHFQDVLLELRRAVRHIDGSNVDPFRQCQIYTNLGNKLNSIGRPVEALVYWDRAIELNSKFALALGNRGNGLRCYGQALHETGHRQLFLLSAHDSYSAASASGAVFDSVENIAHKPKFAAIAEQITGSIDLDAARSVMCKNFSLGKSKAERTYKSWCLENRLFLNPLNDLNATSIAANDVLHLPSLTVGIEEGGTEPPTAFGFYNQLKQEFVSARWIYYEGLNHTKAHFSDKDSLLYDILGIPSYSLETEKTKLAFRMAYSLLDKIAFFINDYFKVGLDERHVSFRGVWYERNNTRKPINNIFKDRENWPLRGLYWLSKDLYEPTFGEASEPDAEGLAELRNHLEHKYCQVYEDMGIGYSRYATSKNGSLSGFRIGRDTLESKGLYILKLVRSALIYLSLAIHREETDRNDTKGERLVGSMPLSIWNDRGKY